MGGKIQTNHVQQIGLQAQKSSTTSLLTPAAILKETVQIMLLLRASLGLRAGVRPFFLADSQIPTAHRSLGASIQSISGFCTSNSPSAPGKLQHLVGFDRYSNNDPNPIISPRDHYFGADDQPPVTKSMAPRLGSTAGRSVAVRSGDIAGALMQLRRICNENSIARDSSLQRFYERPGLKKKRLRRERFRRRFKESFKRMVNTVLEMKRQGI